MDTTDTDKRLHEALLIVDQLQHLLHEDALHRLHLYQKYSQDPDATRWSPDLYIRCQLVDALRRKLTPPGSETEAC